MKNPKNLADGGARRVRKTHQDLQTEALSKHVAKLAAAFDKNTQIFSEAIQVLEIKNNVLVDIISHLHRDGAGLVEAEDGRIDFSYYLKLYLERLGHKEVQAEAAPTPPTIASPEDDAPIIFGGDGP